MTTAFQATLALREVNEDDRNWILSQLSASEKNAIRDVAQELDNPAFNLPPSFELFVAREERIAMSQPPVAVRLNALQSHQIASALEFEPDWVIALILSAHQWPWQNVVLEQFASGRKNQILRIACLPLPDRLTESMLNSFFDRACSIPDHSLPPTSPAPGSLPFFKTIQLRLQGFMTWAF